MDAALFISMALVMTIYVVFFQKESAEGGQKVRKENVDRETKLNESFYEDPDAFCKIIDLLDMRD